MLRMSSPKNGYVKKYIITIQITTLLYHRFHRLSQLKHELFFLFLYFLFFFFTFLMAAFNNQQCGCSTHEMRIYKYSLQHRGLYIFYEICSPSMQRYNCHQNQVHYMQSNMHLYGTVLHAITNSYVTLYENVFEIKTF